MAEYIVTMRNNSVVIPKEIMENHGLKDGDSIEITFL